MGAPAPPLGTRDSVLAPTTLGPGNNDANPRPKAFRFSTFSSFFSATGRPAKFSAAAVVVIQFSLCEPLCPLWLKLLPVLPLSIYRY